MKLLLLLIVSWSGFQQNLLAADTPPVTQKPIILWVSQQPEAEQDLALKGFNYSVNNQFEIDFISVADFSITSLKNDYQYLIGVSDSAWQLIKPLNTTAPKIGIGLSSSLLHSTQKQKQKQANQYLIGNEQPSRRIFALINAMDLNHTQVAALFDKDQLASKLDFIKQAESIEVPFKPININHQSTTIETINSVHNCCRSLIVKHQDFQASAMKHKSLFYESYRRKIITIGNNREMLKLGAMYVIYSEPSQLGQQAADILKSLQADETAELHQEPRDFVVNTNHKLRNIIDNSLTKISIGDLTQKIKLTEQITNNGFKL